jgi:hypothetical protein
MALSSELTVDLTASRRVLYSFHSILHRRLGTGAGPMRLGSYGWSTVTDIAAYPVTLSLQEKRFFRLD